MNPKLNIVFRLEHLIFIEIGQLNLKLLIIYHEKNES